MHSRYNISKEEFRNELKRMKNLSRSKQIATLCVAFYLERIKGLILISIKDLFNVTTIILVPLVDLAISDPP